MKNPQNETPKPKHETEAKVSILDRKTTTFYNFVHLGFE